MGYWFITCINKKALQNIVQGFYLRQNSVTNHNNLAKIIDFYL